MQEKSIIKQNILKYLEFKGITPYRFYKDSGTTRGILDQNNGMNEKNTAKFLDYFPEVNANWLLTGKGKMILSDNSILNEPHTVYETRSLDRIHESQTIPLYDAFATASVVSLFSNPSNNDVIDTLHIPNMPKCDGAIIVTGDSMSPLIKSGDIVCYKTVQDLDNNILYGNMYLINIDFEGDEMLLVKYLHRGEKKGFLKLVSENKLHDPIEVNLKSVLSVALIKGNVRFNFTK